MSLGVDTTQSDQLVRGTVPLPHGIGKSVRVVVFCQGDNADKARAAGAEFAGADDLIERIQKQNWLDFDVALATQDMMGKVSRLGKVLGPRGLMPTPKAGTVITGDVAQAVLEFKAGKVEFRTDKGGNVHAGVGKLSFDDNKLVVTALIRRSVFDSGAWYAEADGYEDWSFWLAVVERGLRGVCVEEPLFRYRRKASEGQLARDHGRREQLKAGLRINHAALFGDAARAELKSRWAAALEILWSGEAADPTLAALLRGQTFDDLAVTERQFADAGELLHEARGKLLLWLGPSDLPALEALGNAALERLVRLAEERRDQDLIAVEAGDTTLLLLRTERASRLGRAHLPAGLPPRELASIFLRRGRGLQYPAAALATAADRPPIARTERSTPRPSSLRSAIDAAAPFFRTARARAAGAIGEERLGKLLHPWKERLTELAWKLDGLAASLRAGRLPRGLAPILSPSERVERLLLDREPVRFGRPSKR